MRDKPVLAIERGFARGRLNASIAPIRQQFTRFRCISEFRHQQSIVDSHTQYGVFYWKERLDATIEVALHHICAAQENLFIATISKVVHPAMLKKTSNDTSHLNCLTQTIDTWTQATYAPYNQLDAHACLRGAIKCVNNFRVNQRIHLKDQVSIAMLAMQGDFSLNALQHALPKPQRSNQQFAIIALT